MKYLILSIIPFWLLSCDCAQRVEGAILDDESEILISAVSIYAENYPDKVLAISDNSGSFDVERLSGGLFGCSDIILVFEKEGYQKLKMKFPAFSTSSVSVRMSKDFSIFSSVRPSVMDTVIRIEIDNYISSGLAGKSNKPPPQYIRSQWLINQASVEELLTLIEYPNGAVQVTAFEGLCKKRHAGVTKIMTEFSTRKDRIYFISGCIGYEILIGEYAYKTVLGLDINGQTTPPRTPEYEKINGSALISDIEKEIITQNLLANRPLKE